MAEKLCLPSYIMVAHTLASLSSACRLESPFPNLIIIQLSAVGMVATNPDVLDLGKEADRNTPAEKLVDLLQRSMFAFRDAEIREDPRENSCGAKDKADLGAEGRVRFVEQVGDGEAGGEPETMAVSIAAMKGRIP